MRDSSSRQRKIQTTKHTFDTIGCQHAEHARVLNVVLAICTTSYMWCKWICCVPVVDGVGATKKGGLYILCWIVTPRAYGRCQRVCAYDRAPGSAQRRQYHYIILQSFERSGVFSRPNTPHFLRILQAHKFRSPVFTSSRVQPPPETPPKRHQPTNTETHQLLIVKLILNAANAQA